MFHKQGWVTQKFDEYIDKKVVKVICTKCGKKRQRTITASQTLNPFNKNKDGEVKSAHEIVRENKTRLIEKIKKFESEKFVCCE